MEAKGRVLAAAALMTALWPAAVLAQLDASTLRGTVVDEGGQPLAGVTVEMEFKGEGRQKVVKTATTDKKGAYIRVGLKPGPWRVTLRKDGYKPGGFDTQLSGGGISEIPPVHLTASAAGAASGGTAPGAAPGPPPAAVLGADEASKQISAAYGKALDALRAGRSAEAEDLFKAIVAAAPNLGPAHYNLAYLYDKKGDVAGAEAEYRRAIEVEPGASDSYVALATLLARAQREEDALKVLTDAAGRFAEDGRFQFALGATAFNMGRTAEAEAAFAKAALLDPANAESLFYLGSLALSRNDVRAAVERLEKYVSVAPESAPNRGAATALLATLKKTK